MPAHISVPPTMAVTRGPNRSQLDPVTGPARMQTAGILSQIYSPLFLPVDADSCYGNDDAAARRSDCTGAYVSVKPWILLISK